MENLTQLEVITTLAASRDPIFVLSKEKVVCPWLACSMLPLSAYVDAYCYMYALNMFQGR